VTFKRLPANWQAQLEQRAAPAEPAEPAKAGPLHYGFLAALGLSVAGACVGESAETALLQQQGTPGYRRASAAHAAYVVQLLLAPLLPSICS